MFTAPSAQPVPTDHGLYDAGLLNASMTAHQYLFDQLREGTMQSLHAAHVRAWALPWYLDTRTETCNSIDDYRIDAAARLASICMQQQLLSIYESNQPDAQRFFQHFGHITVREGLRLHRHDYNVDEEHVTPNDMLLGVRHALYQTFKHKKIIAESPIHPFWKGRSTEESIGGIPLRASNTTVFQQKLLEKLLHPTIGLKETHECRASTLLQHAIPELVEVDGRLIVEYQFPARQKLRSLLKPLQTFKGEEIVRQTTIDTLLDMWVAMDSMPNAQIDQLQVEGFPSIIDGKPRNILDAYIIPLMGDPASAELLSQRFPIVIFLLLRSIAMHQETESQMLLELWGELLNVVETDSRMYSLAALIVYASRKESTPQDIRLQI